MSWSHVSVIVLECYVVFAINEFLFEHVVRLELDVGLILWDFHSL